MEVQEDRVLICKDYNNRPNGEAFVELGDEEEVERSLEKHNQSMGHRWGDTYDEKSRGWFFFIKLKDDTDTLIRCRLGVELREK